MNFLQKKLWIAWSKLRFLRLPVQRRARLEVTTDGRHLTFLLTALGEAGYGVQVYGGDWFFRELMLLRKNAPIPFLYGGKETECGISITDRPSSLDSRPSTLFVLDYDYFSGLLERVEPRISRIYTDGQQGDAQGTCAGDAFSNPSTSELARASGNTSLTRSASVPAGAFFADNVEIESAGGDQLADSMEFLEGQSQAGLQMDNQKGTTIRTANDPSAAWDYSSSVKFDSLDPSHLALRADLRSLHLTPAPALDCGQKSGNIDFPPQALRAPYFMHPSVYHRGLHKMRSPSTTLATRHSAEGATVSHPLPVTSYPPQRRRRFRIGFFGTHDREFYTRHYHFPGMNRFEILEVFLQKFGNRIKHLRGFPRDWDSCEMAVSIDSRGGDRKGKSFLSQDHYFEALGECDFVLSPPGWCMPLSHNLIEAMFCGAIPITNGRAFMAEPLKDGETCLEFQDLERLVAVIERALAMDEREVERMRSYVRGYYDRFLEPKAFAEELSRSDCRRVFLNAEENSVPFVVFPGKF